MFKRLNYRLSLSVLFLLSVLTFSVYTVVTTVARTPEIYNTFLRDKVGSKVVMILSERSGGTGFHINLPSGATAILTNAHICEMEKDGFLQVRLNERDRYVPRRIIEKYSEHDLCLVEGLTGVKGLDLADYSLAPGKSVKLIGYPRLTPLTVSTGEFLGETEIKLLNVSTRAAVPVDKLSPGNLLKFEFKSYTASHISNISYPGNSGSPVVDFYGDVVGVLFAGNRFVITVGYTVPLEVIREFISVY